MTPFESRTKLGFMRTRHFVPLPRANLGSESISATRVGSDTNQSTSAPHPEPRPKSYFAIFFVWLALLARVAGSHCSGCLSPDTPASSLLCAISLSRTNSYGYCTLYSVTLDAVGETDRPCLPPPHRVRGLDSFLSFPRCSRRAFKSCPLCLITGSAIIVQLQRLFRT